MRGSYFSSVEKNRGRKNWKQGDIHYNVPGKKWNVTELDNQEKKSQSLKERLSL